MVSIVRYRYKCFDLLSCMKFELGLICNWY